MKQTELTERQQYWLGHIKACERTGEAMSEYARKHNLDKKRFYNWKWLLAKQKLLDADIGKMSFAKVQLNTRHTAGSNFHVNFPNGCQLVLGDITDSHLKRVIDALVGG